MKGITMFLLLALTSCAARSGVIIIGDSISSSSESWPRYLNAHVLLNAQPGRFIRDFTLSRDIKATPDADTVIYFIGSNDIIFGNPIDLVKEALQSHLRMLKDRGLRVIVVIPAKYPCCERQGWLMREALRNIVAEMKLESVDMNPIWDVNQTYDTVHPTPELSVKIAERIQAALELPAP